MSITGFVIRNALRNKRRLLPSVLSAAVSLFLLVSLMVVLRELTQPPTDADAALRVAVRNKVSLMSMLPQRQRTIIERVPGVEVITPFVWFGGKQEVDGPIRFGTFAIEAAKLRKLLPEIRCDDAQFESWVKDRASCIVGRDTAQQYGYKVGDRFTLVSGIFPTKLELRVAGIYSGTVDDRNMFFHHKYLDEAMHDWGQTGMWWMKVTSTEVMPEVIDTINKAFANSANEVRAESERAFQAAFVSMWGGIKFLIGSISGFVLLTLVMVTASTMSMAVRERFRELAILKALGFRRRDLFALILAESFGLAALGALIGAGGAWLFYSTMDVPKATHGIFVALEVTPQMLGTAALVASLLGIISCLAPAIAVAKMSVTEGLRTLD
jgi:putative ABC transport system permease protein